MARTFASKRHAALVGFLRKKRKEVGLTQVQVAERLDRYQSLSAWHLGFVWIDPLVGIVGAGVIISWTVSLIRSSGAVLLDIVPQPELLQRIRQRLETGSDRITDLHLWRVGPGHAAVIISILSDRPEPRTLTKIALPVFTVFRM